MKANIRELKYKKNDTSNIHIPTDSPNIPLVPIPPFETAGLGQSILGITKNTPVKVRI